MKHAYLIIAHHKFNQLQTLISLLDDKRNDIFVHVDKKVGRLPFLSARSSCLIILDKRIDTRWGDVSQLKTELLLFETAYKINAERYRYYHLLSGDDLPIKTNDYIHDFFERNDGKEFVGYTNMNHEQMRNRVFQYHFLTRHYKQTGARGVLVQNLRIALETIVNALVIRREDMELKKGANWVSITDEFCRYLLSKKDFLFKRFKHTFCCDEFFIQTLLWDSPFKDNIYDLDDEYNGCVRAIDWNRGCPYVWGGGGKG